MKNNSGKSSNSQKKRNGNTASMGGLSNVTSEFQKVDSFLNNNKREIVLEYNESGLAPS